jgi:hypothetical protein
MNIAKTILASIFSYLIIVAAVTAITIFYDYLNNFTFPFPFTPQSTAFFLIMNGFIIVTVFFVLIPEFTDFIHEK